MAATELAIVHSHPEYTAGAMLCSGQQITTSLVDPTTTGWFDVYACCLTASTVTALKAAAAVAIGNAGGSEAGARSASSFPPSCKNGGGSAEPILWLVQL